MGIIFNIIIFILRTIALIAPFIALVYIVTWGIQLSGLEIFNLIDKFLGTLPNHINATYYVAAECFGQETPMGYVYSALLFIILVFISNILIRFFEFQLRLHICKTEATNQHKNKAKKVIRRIKKHIEDFVKLDTFYGLFELKLSHSDFFEKEQEVAKLNAEYSKIIVNKLKDKYPKIQFIATDKIFMIIKDEKSFVQVIEDLRTLFQVFYNINKQKDIETSLLLSFWSTDKTHNPKDALKLLLKINALNFKSKVVITSDIYHYTKNKDYFDYIPLGASKFFNAYGDNQDVDIELFYLKTKKKTI